MKKNILISYVVDADSDLHAIFALHKSLRYMPDAEIIKFDAFDVVDYLCECGDTWCGNREGYGCGKKVSA